MTEIHGYCLLRLSDLQIEFSRGYYRTIFVGLNKTNKHPMTEIHSSRKTARYRQRRRLMIYILVVLALIGIPALIVSRCEVSPEGASLAVIIEGNFITGARVILPVSENEDIDSRLGLRHRAAFGITEKTDAIAIVVSEEKGKITFIKNGEIHPYQDIENLKTMIEVEMT